MGTNIRCPLCGSETTVRTATKGPHAGRKFYVCARYPECKGMVPVKDGQIGKSKTNKARIKSPIVSNAWLIKAIVFGVLLTIAGCFLGLVLRWCGDDSMHMIGGSGDIWDMLRLGCWALAALITVAVTAGIIAVLIRSFWVAAIMVLVSALALFLCWEISLVSFVVALIYFLIGLAYLASVRREINSRIKFRVWNIRSGQGLLLMVLIALVCTGLYFGYSRSIDRNGFTLPPATVDWIVNAADDYALDKMMPEENSAVDREEVLTELRDYLENDISSSEESYKDYVPIIIAAIAFSVLMLATLLVSLVPPIILWLIFLILLRLKVVRKETHTVEVTRLSIE